MRSNQPGVRRVARATVPQRGSNATTANGPWRAPYESTLAVIEIVASEQPDLIEFHVQALRNSPVSFAMRELATDFDVAPEDVGEAVGRACIHLDRLERHRRAWRDPTEVVESPNLAALVAVCRARIRRASPPKRRQKLERILRRVEPAYQLAQTRAWLDDFIGPLPRKRKEAQDADR